MSNCLLSLADTDRVFHIGRCPESTRPETVRACLLPCKKDCLVTAFSEWTPCPRLCPPGRWMLFHGAPCFLTTWLPPSLLRPWEVGEQGLPSFPFAYNPGNEVCKICKWSLRFLEQIMIWQGKYIWLFYAMILQVCGVGVLVFCWHCCGILNSHLNVVSYKAWIPSQFICGSCVLKPDSRHLH